MSSSSIHEMVREYYGKVLSTSNDLKTSCCTTSSRPHPIIAAAREKVPVPIRDKFYGCGAPIPLGIEGKDVLDLGSGSGLDCYIAALLVGKSGSVLGIDMTDEQLQVAREHVNAFTETHGLHRENLAFVKGYIELLEQAGIPANSKDIVISNCVLNLSPDKPKVLDEVYRVLRKGGEFYFSDVFCDRRLPESVKSHPVLVGECIGGAMYVEDFKRAAQKSGFVDPRMISSSRIPIDHPELSDLVGNAKFWSITWRLFKLEDLESLCEDYGQFCVYKGSITGHRHVYQLDDHHIFETGKRYAICGNTAAMLGDSWLKGHFEIVGDRSVHYGLFDCSSSITASTDSKFGGCC